VSPPTLNEVGGWAAVLGSLASRRDLSVGEAGAAMTTILSGEATPAQIGAFIVALRMKGESVAEINALLDVMLELGERVPLDDDLAAIDTCGTGGDASCTINVSTIAAFVVAGAGVPVCKHGNRAASSQCGSADVLEELGVVIDLGPAGVASCIAEAGIGFCFAPRYHPAMRHAGPVRRELGVRTVFNFLGPMANPGRVRRQVLGVSDPAMAERMAAVLQSRGAVRALVVYGHDGLDEFTTTTTSTVLELRDGEVRTFELDPTELGLAPAPPEALQGSDAPANAKFARMVLDGEPGYQRDIVLLNAAAGLVVGGLAEDLAEGLEAAGASIEDGRAAAALEGLVAASQAAAASAPEAGTP
jgi:anthranilate phosphoribosyltransferase